MSLARALIVGAVLAAVSALPAHAVTVAYDYPTGLGNQSNFSGALGMDFNVLTQIRITALGVFDSGQNGLMNNLNVRIYNRDTQAIVASASFSPSSIGYGLGASDFKDLANSLLLQPGFHGSIVAEGYGILEMNGNSNSSSNYATSLNSEGGAIAFVGSSRNGPFGSFPTNPDGSIDRYGAGTFRFSSVPEPASCAAMAMGFAGLVRWGRRRKR